MLEVWVCCVLTKLFACKNTMQLETKSTWFFVCYLLATQNSKKQNNETKTQRKHNNKKKRET